MNIARKIEATVEKAERLWKAAERIAQDSPYHAAQFRARAAMLEHAAEKLARRLED